MSRSKYRGFAERGERGNAENGDFWGGATKNYFFLIFQQLSITAYVNITRFTLILCVLLLSDDRILKMLRHCQKCPKQGIFTFLSYQIVKFTARIC